MTRHNPETGSHLSPLTSGTSDAALDRELEGLLDAIRKEPVPDRLLELAQELQRKLTESARDA